MQSTTSKAPSQILSAEHLSSVKLGWPGVSIIFIKNDFSFEFYNTSDIGVHFMLIFLYCSSYLVSVYLKSSSYLIRFGWVSATNISIRHVLP